MLYMTVWAIKHRTFVNNFAYETAEINIEVKHLLQIYNNDATINDIQAVVAIFSLFLGIFALGMGIYSAKTCKAEGVLGELP